MDRDQKEEPPEPSSLDQASPTSIETEFEKHFSLTKSASERQSLIDLTRGLTRLPLDQAAAALETSGSIAGVSLRASIEFLRAT
ncbi:MAG: hypothetical protein ACRD8U_08550, partial [Pyrinomonadaceae bacterium]